MQLKVILKLIRWKEVGPLSIFTPFTSALIATGFKLDWIILSAMMSVLAIVSYGFAVNNISDVELDKSSSKPSKNPISVGEIPLNSAYRISTLLAILAIGFLSVQPLVNICLGVLLMFLYHTYSLKPRIKGRPPFDMVYHVLLWAIPLAMGYLTYKPPDAIVILLFVISCNLSAVSEFINQIMDYETDMTSDIKTTAVLIGRERSLKLSIALTICAFILIMLLCSFGAVHWILVAFTSSASYFVISPMNEVLISKNYMNLEKVYRRGAWVGIAVVNLLIFTKLYL